MIPLLLVAIALVSAFRAPRWMAVVLAVAVAPLATALVAVCVTLAWRAKMFLRARRADRDASTALARFADLVALSLGAGHNVTGALTMAAHYTTDDLEREVARALRLGRQRGLAATLLAWQGRAAELFGVMGRALETGAPVVGVVSQWADERTAAVHAASLQRAEKLPVKLLFPLALLVLPGFTLLLLAPAIVLALDRLAG